MAVHNELGKWGEQLACDKLVRDGYAIVERNWRMHHYEIDIIATKGNRIAFVEVKTRSERGGDPFEAIDRKKMLHMTAAANVYIQSTNSRLEPQFDIIGISGSPQAYDLEHIEDAFLPPLKTY